MPKRNGNVIISTLIDAALSYFVIKEASRKSVNLGYPGAAM